MRRLIYLITLAMSTVIQTGCGPAWHLKQAELKGAKVTTDTLYRERLVLVPSVTHDTTFISQPGDTVTVSRDRLQVKYVRLPGDSVFIEGTCLQDTIKITVPVEVTRTIEAGYSVWDIIKWCLFVAMACFLGFGAYRILSK